MKHITLIVVVWQVFRIHGRQQNSNMVSEPWLIGNGTTTRRFNRRLKEQHLCSPAILSVPQILSRPPRICSKPQPSAAAPLPRQRQIATGSATSPPDSTGYRFELPSLSPDLPSVSQTAGYIIIQPLPLYLRSANIWPLLFEKSGRDEEPPPSSVNDHHLPTSSSTECENASTSIQRMGDFTLKRSREDPTEGSAGAMEQMRMPYESLMHNHNHLGVG